MTWTYRPAWYATGEGINADPGVWHSRCLCGVWMQAAPMRRRCSRCDDWRSQRPSGLVMASAWWVR